MSKDTIYRQAAIEAIHEDADWLAAQGSDWQVERMERDKSILKSLPSAEPEQHWIPLADKEPTEEGEYLVTFDDGFVVTTGYYDGDFELWADAGEPIAWMPLPEPWKGADDEAD